MYQRLAETAAWMAHSRESLIGADAAPEPNPANVPVTVRGRRWYLHLLPGTDGEILVRLAQARPGDVRLLRTDAPLSFTVAGDVLHVTVPAALRTPLVDVVTLDFPV